MFNITSRFLAVALALTTIAASAQEPAGRSDMFNQDPANVNDPSSKQLQQSQHRANITNAPTQREGGAATNLGNVPQPVAMKKTAVRGAADAVEDEKSTSVFQKFIADSTGSVLPIFGSEFFVNAPSTFAPILNSPVPSDYRLGPGDELLIRGWGTIDIDYRATIDRNGTITIPTVGSVVLAGVKAGDAEGVVRGAISRLYKGVTVSVNFGQLRAITVYVVGQASRPGTYTVSSLSTLVTALFASGGPNANGSMRRVQVKRGGRVAAELDLYAFIAKGDKSADIKLQDGDTIYIPPAGGLVALVGKVNAPAIYELKTGGDRIGELLDFAGGLPVVADPRRAFLERVDSSKSHPRSVEQFPLDSEGLMRPLKNGDVLKITSITPDFSNAVMLRGNVDQPLRAPFTPGMRVSDLIPSREYLISRAATKRQNSTVGADDQKTDTADTGNLAAQIGGKMDAVNWDYAVIERINRADLSVNLIPFNLGNVFSSPSGPDNVQLQPGDTVTIFSQEDVAVPIDKRRIFVRIEGEVNVPGVYQMSAGETLQSLMAKAGGPTTNAYLFGTAFYRETVRREQEANLRKAASRLETQMRSEQSASLANLRGLSPNEAQAAASQRVASAQLEQETVARLRELKPTGRIAFGLDPAERSFSHLPQIKLENGDRLVVPAKQPFVHVFGAVNAEASPLWRPNTRVKDYLAIAGPTAGADLENIFVMRVDGTVVSADSGTWFSSGVGGLEVMPGDTIVIPEKFDKETKFTKFTRATREWAQIFANFGLGAAAIKTLSN